MKDQRAGMAEWIERLRQAATRAVTEEDMREIFQALVVKAKQGNLKALEVLMRYLQPPPPPQLPTVPNQVKANVVNIYPGRSGKRKAKLLRDEPLVIDHKNGKPPRAQN